MCLIYCTSILFSLLNLRHRGTPRGYIGHVIQQAYSNTPSRYLCCGIKPLVGLQSRFGDESFSLTGVCPQNGAAALKGTFNSQTQQSPQDPTTKLQAVVENLAKRASHARPCTPLSPVPRLPERQETTNPQSGRPVGPGHRVEHSGRGAE